MLTTSVQQFTSLSRAIWEQKRSYLGPLGLFREKLFLQNNVVKRSAIRRKKEEESSGRNLVRSEYGVVRYWTESLCLAVTAWQENTWLDSAGWCCWERVEVTQTSKRRCCQCLNFV